MPRELLPHRLTPGSVIETGSGPTVVGEVREFKHYATGYMWTLLDLDGQVIGKYMDGDTVIAL
jgi:hypothetical protein